jgi:hypothetical protein
MQKKIILAIMLSVVSIASYPQGGYLNIYHKFQELLRFTNF